MKKILIVEDDESVADVLQARLAKSGFQVIWALDAYQGLTLAKSEAPDLIILDLMLPGGGGEATLKNLKMSSKTSFTPVLVLTASTDAELKRRMLAEGVVGYMEKPYDGNELIRAIHAVLDRNNS
jgi:DNA-binding response OmpR family regulator